MIVSVAEPPAEAQMQFAQGKVCAPAVFSVFPHPVLAASSVVSALAPVLHILPSSPASCAVLAPPLPSSLLHLHPALQCFQIWHECLMAWQLLYPVWISHSLCQLFLAVH